MGDGHETAIVVPCFDEARRLDPERFAGAVAADADLSILFVDDGSRDGTGGVLAEICAHDPARLQRIRLDRNTGKAEAVRRGLVRALDSGVPFAGYFDADLATPLTEVAPMRAAFDDPGVYAVLGSRVALLGRDIRRSPVRHYSGRIFATAASAILGLPVYDTQCGAKLFRNLAPVRTAFADPFQVRWTFDVEILARFQRLARTGGLGPVETGVREHPVSQWRDVSGSKLRVADSFRAMLELERIRRAYRPEKDPG